MVYSPSESTKFNNSSNDLNPYCENFVDLS